MKIILFLFISLLIIAFPCKIYASYTLPYPGIMPGNKLYLLAEAIDYTKGFFAFGDFATFSYNLSQSDKYLIEAKTLFEYGQHELALRALKKSNLHINESKKAIELAAKHHKNISEKEKKLHSAIDKHNQILSKLYQELPEEVLWSEEDQVPVKLKLRKEINTAVNLRSSL